MAKPRPWCVVVDGRIVARKETRASAEVAAESLETALRSGRWAKDVRAIVVRQPASQRQRPASPPEKP